MWQQNCYLPLRQSGYRLGRFMSTPLEDQKARRKRRSTAICRARTLGEMVLVEPDTGIGGDDNAGKSVSYVTVKVVPVASATQAREVRDTSGATIRIAPISIVRPAPITVNTDEQLESRLAAIDQSVEHLISRVPSVQLSRHAKFGRR